MNRWARYLALAVMVITPQVRADDAVADGAHKTGRYTLTLGERDPRSAIDELQKRYGWTDLRGDHESYEYEPGEATYEVVVPERYREGAAHGVVVWIDPGPKGAPPDEWLKALAARRLIWIGANDAGDERQPSMQRLMLAIDGAHAIARRYTIDPRRVYVAGFSGGGRMASHAAMAFPDVFTGAMPMGGVDYVRRIVVPDTEYQFRSFNQPPNELFDQVKKESRWVLIAGEHDQNKPQTEVVNRAMIADRFAHVSYLEQPGLGHERPKAATFARALALLDEPLVAEARKAFADGETFEHRGRFGAALAAYERAGRSAALDASAAEGARKAAELRKRLDETVAAIEAKIAAGETDGLAADVAALRRDWSPAADEALDRLAERLGSE